MDDDEEEATGKITLASSRWRFADSVESRSAPVSKVGRVFKTAASWVSNEGTTSNESSTASSSILNKLEQLLAVLEQLVDAGISVTFKDAFLTLFSSGLV